MADELGIPDRIIREIEERLNSASDINARFKEIAEDAKHVNLCFECRATEYALDAVEVLISKHEDYGPSNISDAPGGALNGLRVRLHDKVARLNNLIDKGVDPQHESLFDTFLDIANYGLIGMMILEDDWDEK